jgi:hypothetical protein
VIIKLTVGELKELLKYEDGPFGERGFNQFMAGMCARIDEDTGEVDIDRDDTENIVKYSNAGKKRVLDRIFKRALDDAMRRFLGR